MTFDPGDIVFTILGALIGWVVRSAVAIGDFRSKLDRIELQITEIARRESQHAVGNVKQMILDHDETLKLHGERLTDLTVRVQRGDHGG